ncbi:MAG: xanthine dehydrogenase family protein subunit M [Gemmatimonadaceae bacterium]
MKPAAFIFHRAATLDDALALLADHPEAKPLAGGQSLIPAMNFRLAHPAALVDLNGVRELAGIAATADGGLRIGAMTRHLAVERSDLVRQRSPLLAETMPHVAHPQIRSRGTIGGSLAHADPSAELPAVMIALDARFQLRARGADRWVRATDFFTGLFATALAPGELLTAIEIPSRAARAGSAFLEVARRHGDYALAGVAVELSLDAAGRISRAWIALLSVGDGPVLTAASGSLVGQDASAANILATAELVRAEVDPPSDIHADAAYRRQLAAVLTRRALTIAAERARTA